MTDKIDTSTLGRIDLASGKSAPVPIEECVSTWAVDDGIQSLIAENERLRDEVAAVLEKLLAICPSKSVEDARAYLSARTLLTRIKDSSKPS